MSELGTQEVTHARVADRSGPPVDAGLRRGCFMGRPSGVKTAQARVSLFLFFSIFLISPLFEFSISNLNWTSFKLQDLNFLIKCTNKETPA